jgi:hypothetical protein
LKPITPMLIGLGAAAPLATFNVSAASVIVTQSTSSAQATASAMFNTDGTVTCSVTSLGAGAWHSNPASGLGNSYWVTFTPTTGTVTTGTISTRIQLSANTAWTALTTGTGISRRKYVTGTFEIWDAASAGNMVSTGTLTLDAQVEASGSYTSPPVDDGSGNESLPYQPV